MTNIVGRGPLPAWLPYFDISCVFVAGFLWMALPGASPWPLLIALAPWPLRWAMARTLAVRTPSDFPIILFLATAVVSVWSAYDREMAWSKFWLIVGAILLFYAFSNWSALFDNSVAVRQMWLLAFLGGAVALFFLIGHDWDAYPAKISVLTSIGRAIQSLVPTSLRSPISGTIHPNVNAGIIALLLPFSVASGWLAFKRNQVVGVVLGSLIVATMILALILSTSRGAWLAVALAAGLLGWWTITRKIIRSRRQRRYWFFGLPVALGLGMFAIIIIWPDVLTKLFESLPAAGTGLKRVELYAGSLTLANDYPLIGSGLGTFQLLYSTYALLVHVGFIGHSHNMYLDIFIEQGAVALLSLGWMWLLMGEAAWRSMAVIRVRRSPGLGRQNAGSDRQGERQKMSRIATYALRTAGLSLLIMLVHGLVDDALYSSRGIIIFFVPLAFAVPQLQLVDQSSRLPLWQRIALVLLVIVILLLILWRPVTSKFYSNLAAVRQSQMELGKYSWPDWPVQDAVRRSLDLDSVIDGYLQALSVDPYNSSAGRRLGQIALSLGQYEAALSYLELAYRANPEDTTTRRLLAEAYTVNGQITSGSALWQTVNNEQAQLELRRFWYDNIQDQEKVRYIDEVIKRIDAVARPSNDTLSQ